MSMHPVNETTEFLAKSLVGAGVFLAIPAALLAAHSVLMLVGASPYDWSSHVGWLLFCLLGFALLFLAFRIVRHPECARHPRIVWASTALYLGTITAAGVWWLVAAYNQAREHNLRVWTSEDLDPSILLVPAILLLFPFYGFILSVLLCTRPKCA
jgi:hypothetical protein